MSESKTTTTTSYTPAVTFKGDAATTEALKAIPLSSFPKPKGGVVIIPSTASVLEAAKTLSDNNILCAPVRDVSKPDDAVWHDKYLGLVDMTDIVIFVCRALEGKYDGRPSFMETVHNASMLTTTKVTEVLHVFKFGPFVPLVEADSSLLDAVLILGKHGLHRLCVVGMGGTEVVNFLTQSSLLGALRLALPAVEHIGTKTLKEMGLAEPKDVAQANMDDCVWTALDAMRKAHVSAVPITGADGTIVGVFSNRDVRNVLQDADMYPRLFRSLREFLAAKVAKEVDAKALAVTVSPDDTLATTVLKLDSLRLHRLFVVDAANRPISVVSLSDILSVLAIEPADYFGSYFD